MSQQHAQFEEEFRDGPFPYPPYQENYADPPSLSYTATMSPIFQSSMHEPAQKLQEPAQNTRQAAPGIGARVFLAIVTMIFVMGMFLVALAMSSARDPVNNVASTLAILFSFVFAVLAVIINLIVNRRH